MALRSPEATIDFLLTCLDCVEGKPDWDKVTVKTGWYKTAQVSRQTFNKIQKKYAGTKIGGGAKSNSDGEGDGGGTTQKSRIPKKSAARDEGEKSSSKKVKQDKDAMAPEDKESGGGENGSSEFDKIEHLTNDAVHSVGTPRHQRP